MSIRAFLKNPYDPRNNLAVFATYVEPFLPKPRRARPLTLDDALTTIHTVARLYPDLKVPTDDEIRAVWEWYGPRSHYLIATHDLMHGELNYQQTPAGEYALGARLVFGGRYAVLEEASYGQRMTEVLYGLLTMSSLPVGCLRSPDMLAPIRGVVSGVLGVWLGRDV